MSFELTSIPYDFIDVGYEFLTPCSCAIAFGLGRIGEYPNFWCLGFNSLKDPNFDV